MAGFPGASTIASRTSITAGTHLAQAIKETESASLDREADRFPGGDTQ